jgi:1-phosphofructokinase
MLNNLGVENKALGFVAGETGELVEQGLKERGMNTDFIRLPEGDTRINVKVRGKLETEVNGSGPHIPDAYIQQLMEKLDQVNDDDVIVLSGSVPRSVSKDVYANIMEQMKGRPVKIVVDAAGELMKNVLPHRPFLIKPNRAELEGLAGKVLGRTREIMRSAKDLQAQGARNVLVSLGGDGALLLDETGKFHRIGVPKGELKSSVGSGDSMVAGFLAGYQKTGDYVTALRTGAACGSASAFSTALATREEVESMYHELELMEVK